jgi:TolB-like protein
VNPLPLLCVLGWLGAAPGAAPAEDKGNSVAVLKMEAKKGVDPSTAELLSQSLTARVRATGRFHTVVGFTEIESLLGFERQKQLMQCEASSCMAEVAGAMGVRYIIATSVGRLGSAWLINASLVDTATARAENAVTERVDGGDESALDGAVDRVVRKLLGAPVAATPPAGAVKPPPTLPPSATPAGPPRADGQKSWDDFGLDDALDRRKPAAQGGTPPPPAPAPTPPPTASPAPPPAATPPPAARPAPRPAPLAPAPPQAAVEDEEDGDAQDDKNDKRAKKKSKRKAAREKADAERPTPLTQYFFPYGFGGAVALGAAAVVTFLLWGPVTAGFGLVGAAIDSEAVTFPISTLVCGGIGFLCCGVVLGSMVAGIVALVAGSVRSVVTYVRQRVVDAGGKAAVPPPARAHAVLVAADAEEL